MYFNKKDLNKELTYGDYRLNYTPEENYELQYERYLPTNPKEVYIGRTKNSLNKRADNGKGYFHTGLGKVVGIHGMKSLVSKVYAITPSHLSAKVEADRIAELKNLGYTVYNLNDGSTHVEQALRQTQNVYKQWGPDKVIVEVNHNGVCVFDTEVYFKFYADKYLSPAQSSSYSKHGFSVSQGGYIQFRDRNRIGKKTGRKGSRTSVNQTLPELVLGKYYNEVPHTETTYLDGNKRNYLLTNFKYGGKTLAEWVKYFNITF